MNEFKRGLRDAQVTVAGVGETLAEMVNKLRGCRFLPGSGPKRFVRQLVFCVSSGEDLETTLSDRQKEWLRKLRHQYRRQIEALNTRPQS